MTPHDSQIQDVVAFHKFRCIKRLTKVLASSASEAVKNKRDRKDIPHNTARPQKRILLLAHSLCIVLCVLCPPDVQHQLSRSFLSILDADERSDTKALSANANPKYWERHQCKLLDKGVKYQATGNPLDANALTNPDAPTLHLIPQHRDASRTIENDQQKKLEVVPGVYVERCFLHQEMFTLGFHAHQAAPQWREYRKAGGQGAGATMQRLS
ncbi:hypothetical protein DFS33DRAFT_1269212 [Desarmillaria ectypa]|nr:hypothetical protein DFS33DRAFT_1269212 [Desarmillaria ectypa]